jgi:hypothetical protein
MLDKQILEKILELENVKQTGLSYQYINSVIMEKILSELKVLNAILEYGFKVPNQVLRKAKERKEK